MLNYHHKQTNLWMMVISSTFSYNGLLRFMAKDALVPIYFLFLVGQQSLCIYTPRRFGELPNPMWSPAFGLVSFQTNHKIGGCGLDPLNLLDLSLAILDW